MHLAINSGHRSRAVQRLADLHRREGLDRQGVHRRLDHGLRQGGRRQQDDASRRRPQITGLTADQIRQSAEWIAQPKAGDARRRTMFAYEKGLIWGNDNYRTNGALVNVALATGNIGRPGGGCVRLGGHQEGYSRPSDAHVGKPAAYVDQAPDRRQGRRAPHLGLRPLQDDAERPAVQAGLQAAHRPGEGRDVGACPMATAPRKVAAIMDAIKKGGLFSVDVDIIPTQIGQASHVWLPAATSGEMNLTSMNGERRMRLTERYMDPPGRAMPDCLIAARIANHMERVFREQGKADVADRFKGFDWKTEEDAFMDGYHKHEKGGEFVTYARLRAMGTNGFQEPAVGLEGGPSGVRQLPGQRRPASSPGWSCKARPSRRARGKEPVQQAARAQPRRRSRRRARNASSARSASTPTASSTRRTARPSSWRRSGAACRPPGRRRNRRSSRS